MLVLLFEDLEGCWCKGEGGLLVGEGTLLLAAAGAWGASVVAAAEAAAVVVAEFNDDKVAGLDEVCDLGEATLAGEASGTASANGFVDDGDGEHCAEVVAPTVGCAVVRTAVGHGGVAAEVDGLGVDDGGGEEREKGELELHDGRWGVKCVGRRSVEMGDTGWLYRTWNNLISLQKEY